MENNEVPKLIAGIPTDKKASVQRREIIKQTYLNLLQKLQQARGKKAVFNDFLGVDVYITMHESGKKASNSATFNWQSTYAVQKLETIIKKAKPREGISIWLFCFMNLQMKSLII